VELLLETAEEHFPEWHAFLLCALRTGLRLGELRALEWGDFDWRRRFIRIERNFVEGAFTTPKSGLARNVDMSLQLRAVLRLWRRQQRAAWFHRGRSLPDLVFSSEARTPLDDSNVRKAMLAIVNKAEVRRRRSVLHVLRHTFASLLIQQGESLTYVKEWC
jgi:integrase